MVRIYPKRLCIYDFVNILTCRGDLWSPEGVHRTSLRCGGSNLSTDPKSPKCIYKISKNIPLDSLFCGKATAVEKPVQGFSKSRLSSPSVNKPKEKTTARVVFSFGWGSWTRTNEMQESKSCALTDLAIPHNGNIIHIFLTLVNRKTSYSFSVNLKIE